MQVVRAFVDAINRRSPDEIAGLMTEDHVFIDSLGSRVTGREAMKKGWEAYFRIVPDYSITVEETFTNGAVCAMLGTAQGSFSGKGWQTPAAWRAVVRDSLISEWRVYADNEPIRELMRKAG
ncbi:MAG TPA: nuclear transport factor 2 family protein [Bryobacteraceae bacterium]|nr:nuclear transport factor 2 family protein [Bryobacteraceae bacterium]